MKAAAFIFWIGLAGAASFAAYSYLGGASDEFFQEQTSKGHLARPSPLQRYARQVGVSLEPASYRNLLPRQAGAATGRGEKPQTDVSGPDRLREPGEPAAVSGLPDADRPVTRGPDKAPPQVTTTAGPARRPLLYEKETSKLANAAAKDPPAIKLGTTRYRRVIPDSAGSLKTKKNVRIILAEIEALEPDVKCRTSKGAQWPCGNAGMFALRRFIRGRAVVCDLIEVVAEGAALARCRVRGRDINQWLVRQGWAIPKEGVKRLQAALEVAKKENRGQWAKEWPGLR